MKQEYEDESYSDASEEAGEIEEDNDGELSDAEEGFLRGYEEEIEDPHEEARAEQEELEY